MLLMQFSLFCISDFIFSGYTLEGSGTLVLEVTHALGFALSLNSEKFGFGREGLFCSTLVDINLNLFEYFQLGTLLLHKAAFFSLVISSY
jgi:hypothetical protein